MRLPRLLPPLLALAVAGCATGASSGTTSPATLPPASVSGALAAATQSPADAPTPPPSTAPSASPTTSPSVALLGDPVPAALRGTWQVQDPNACAGCGWFLTLSGRNYAAYKDPLTAQDALAGIHGNELLLGGYGSDCTTTATYRWTLVSKTSLRLRIVGTDPCPRGAAFAPGTLALMNRDESVAPATPLTGSVPPQLQGTWAVDGSGSPSQKFVFGRSMYAVYTGSLNDVAAGPMAAQGSEFSMGPRSDNGCSAVGLYSWTLVSPTRLVTVAENHDLCPRSEFLAAGHLTLLSRALNPMPSGSGG